MRLLLVILGVAVIGAYAIFGALLMNDWAVVAASEAPLDTTIADMRAAHEHYSVVPGVFFAVLGGAGALTWGILTVRGRGRISYWVSLAVWAGILAFGAPAYFFASFPNMNSVGDTYVHWNSAAASALEVPLYLISGIAFLVALAASIIALINAAVPKNAPLPTYRAS